MKNNVTGRHLLVAIMAVLLACCKKEAATVVLPPVPAKPVILKIMDSIDNFSMFRYAIKKANLDTAIASNGNYTVFAIDNASMTTAGLTKDGIDRLNTDTLKKLISYHVVIGGFPDSVLAQSSNYIGAQTIRQDLSFAPLSGYRIYRQYLYIMLQGGKLYVNTQLSNNGEKPVQAGNGWIYTTNRVFSAPVNSLYDIIKSRPELSLYFTSLRIIDSIYNSVRAATTPFPKILDSPFLASVGPDFQYVNNYFGNSGTSNLNLLALPTVLAPVNAAFINIGLNNATTIKNYCLKRSTTMSGIVAKTTYIGLDSVLKDHILFYPMDQYYNFIFYEQFFRNPAINNNIHNMCLYSRITNINFPILGTNTGFLQFSIVGDTVFVVPNGNPGMAPARLLAGARDILATNGIIHETDRLLPPKP